MPREGKPATCDEGYSESDNDNTKPGTTISATKKEEKKSFKKRSSHHKERRSKSDDGVVEVAQSDDLIAKVDRLLVIPDSKKSSRKPTTSAPGGSHRSPKKSSARPGTTERTVSFKENPRLDKNAKEYFGRKNDEDVRYTTSSTSRSTRPPLAIPRNMNPNGRPASFHAGLIPVHYPHGYSSPMNYASPATPFSASPAQQPYGYFPPPPQAPNTLADRFSRTGQPTLNDTSPITFAPRQRAPPYYYGEDQGNEEDESDPEEQRREAREAQRAHEKEKEKLEKKRLQKLLREREREAQLDDEDDRLDRLERLAILEREHLQREREQQILEDSRRMPPPGLPQSRGSYRHSRDGGIPRAPESPSIEDIQERLRRLNHRSHDERDMLHNERSERPHIGQRGIEPAMPVHRPRISRTSKSSSASYHLDPSYRPRHPDVEVPGVRRDRRNSFYTGASSTGPSATSSNFEETERAAREYQDQRAAEVQPKLTVDSLHKQQKAIAGSRSTRSTTSRDDSEFKQSATTRTTRSGSGDGLETIMIDGTAKLTYNGAEVHINQQDGPVRLAFNGNNGDRLRLRNGSEATESVSGTTAVSDDPVARRPRTSRRESTHSYKSSTENARFDSGRGGSSNDHLRERLGRRTSQREPHPAVDFEREPFYPRY